MVLLVLGLALILLILIVVLYALHRSDTSEMEIEVIRPSGNHCFLLNRTKQIVRFLKKTK